MRESRCIIPFLLLWSLVPPAAEAQESAALFRFFHATPPWAAEAPGVARARSGLGLSLFLERQESLRIARQEKTLRIRDLPSGREESSFLREDPALLNRKFDILLELEGAGNELSVPLPGVPSLEIYPSLVFQAAAADLDLDFQDRNRAEDSTSYGGWGALLGTGLDVTASLCRSCPWFAAAGYRFQKIPGHGVDRSPELRPGGFGILEDETQLEREVHEVSARAGYSFPGNRIASYVGVRHRSTALEIDNELRYRDPSGTTETHISTRSRLESETTLALAGLEAHLAGPFYARIDAAVGDEDRVVSAHVAYLFPRPRVRITEEPPIWPALGVLLESGPQISFRRNLATGFGVIAGGWPVAVEYELKKDGFLMLTVTTEGGDPIKLRLPPEGIVKTGERLHQIVQMPAALGSEPQPAIFNVQAFAARKSEKPIDFAFYGIGAGKGAIASLAIDQVSFAPNPPLILSIRRGDKAEYKFRSRAKFNQRPKALVYIHPSDPDAFPHVIWEKRIECFPDPVAQCPPDYWDGRDNGGNISDGLHVLQLNVWDGVVEGGGHWVAVVAPGVVQVVR